MALLLTTAQAAQELGLSEDRTRRLCHNGEIEGAWRHGNSWLIPSPVKRLHPDASWPAGHITLTQASQELGKDRKRVWLLCKQGRIVGARMVGNQWAIPTPNRDTAGYERTAAQGEGGGGGVAMKVYMVYEDFGYDGPRNVACFSTEEKARTNLSKHRSATFIPPMLKTSKSMHRANGYSAGDAITSIGRAMLPTTAPRRDDSRLPPSSGSRATRPTAPSAWPTGGAVLHTFQSGREAGGGGHL